MSTALVEQSTTALIRGAMERVEMPDVRAISELVAADLDDERLREFALRGIAEAVRGQMSPRHHRAAAAEVANNGSARWESVKEASANGDLENWRVFTGTGDKWLLDCEPVDLRNAAEQSERIAAGHKLTAKGYCELADAVESKRGAKVVGDLSHDKVRGLLNA